MKQEAANTFSEGLNYDLNATTTPNNILTDCVNGTFVTFNGDELALQNDAGNTTIKYLETDVHLTPGFYPLGIKEYGGVLYIVSGKKPTIIPTKWGPGSYSRGAVVYKPILEINYYYESLVYANNHPLPYESNEYWLSIGVEKDFINKYGFVEFGSYPSPEIIDSDLFDTSVDFSVINTIDTIPADFKAQLYNPQVVNNSVFRAGVYAEFFKKLGTTLNTNYVSYPVFDITESGIFSVDTNLSVKNIYKVRLLHQLSNGFIDLTDNVWEKFAEFVFIKYGETLNASTTRFWFDDPDFKYYCPHNYKGKLVMVVELENLDLFELNPIEVTYNGTDTYSVNFSVNLENTTLWEVSTFSLIYTLDNSEPRFGETSETNGLSVTFTIPVDDQYQNAVMKYKIVPEFYFDGAEIPRIEFPQQFIDEHTIIGSQLISTEVDDVVIYAVVGPDPICEVGYTGYQIIERLILMDSAGNYLDNELIPFADAFSFYLLGTDPPIDEFNLGSYEIDATNQAFNVQLNPLIELTSAPYVVSLVENTYVRILNEQCGYVTLTVNVNKSFGDIVPITVTQGASNIAPIGPILPGATSFDYLIRSAVSTTIKPRGDIGVIYDNAYFYTLTWTDNATIDFGLITELGTKYIRGIEDDPFDYIYYQVDILPSIFGTGIPTNRFATIQTSEYYVVQVYPIPIVGGTSGLMFKFRPDTEGHAPTFLTVFNNLSTNIYDNLSGVQISIEGDNNIFLKSNELHSIPPAQ